MGHVILRDIGASLPAICTLALLAGPATAEEDAGTHLAIELNAAAHEDAGCKLSFVALNGHGTDIGAAVFETVLFDAEGQVDRLTLLDFGSLPAGRPRVRQFVISGTACADIGQVLLNGAATCQSSALEADPCTKGLELSTRTPIEFTG